MNWTKSRKVKAMEKKNYYVIIRFGARNNATQMPFTYCHRYDNMTLSEVYANIDAIVRANPLPVVYYSVQVRI